MKMDNQAQYSNHQDMKHHEIHESHLKT